MGREAHCFAGGGRKRAWGTLTVSKKGVRESKIPGGGDRGIDGSFVRIPRLSEIEKKASVKDEFSKGGWGGGAEREEGGSTLLAAAGGWVSSVITLSERGARIGELAGGTARSVYKVCRKAGRGFGCADDVRKRKKDVGVSKEKTVYTSGRAAGSGEGNCQSGRDLG